MLGLLVKQSAKAPETSYGLAGRLYLSSSGWLLLSVPNAVVRGLYDALDEPGAELWLDDDGKLNAHITVMHKDEVERIDPARITERGHTFRYTLGRLKKVKPHGAEGYSDVWFVEVKSPALEKLRKSYGLTNRPKDNEFQFHITVARRKTGVLLPGGKSKAAEVARGDREAFFQYAVAFNREDRDSGEMDLVSDQEWKRLEREWRSLPAEDKLRWHREAKTASGERPKTVAVDLDGTLAVHYDEFDPQSIPDPRPGAREEMQRLRDAGVRLIVHTVRGQTDTVQAWLKKHKIPFDHVNENPHQPPDSSDKLYADVYVDDRAVCALPSLDKVFAEVRERLGLKKEAATLRQEVARQARKTERPTEAQAEAGNYRKGHVSWQGLEISIETAAGQRRNPKWPPLKHHYGYFRRTEGKDGDHVDVFVGPHLETELVFVVNQIDPDTGKFDEHKCVVGARSEEEAKEIYQANYSKDWKGLDSVVGLTTRQFKDWLQSGDQKKPIQAPALV